ncbi:MAG: hypothetical protein EXR62_16335 [Chloroflexi bacterium]|nr:hypothetical protein [Chloroflexota bacterium]
MPVSFRSNEVVLLDACCILNLYATRCMEQILQTIPARFAVAEMAAAEALYVRRGGDGEDADAKEAIDLQPLIRAGWLQVLPWGNDQEKATFVIFAAELDDGEAMTCALAFHREAIVATDDRKTRRVLQARAPHIPVVTTTELVKQWADLRTTTQPFLRQVWVDIRDRARFVPGRADPWYAWWDNILQDQ